MAVKMMGSRTQMSLKRARHLLKKTLQVMRVHCVRTGACVVYIVFTGAECVSLLPVLGCVGTQCAGDLKQLPTRNFRSVSRH